MNDSIDVAGGTVFIVFVWNQHIIIIKELLCEYWTTIINGADRFKMLTSSSTVIYPGTFVLTFVLLMATTNQGNDTKQLAIIIFFYAIH